MASPLKTGKKAVDLTPAGPRGSRIRRDPPPAAQKDIIIERDERDRLNAVIGVVTFALAIVVILLGFSGFVGWSPRDYTAHL